MVMIFCLFLLVSGLCIVDYSVNSLLRNNSAISMITLKNKGDFVELSVLNRRLYFNTAYMSSDMEKIRRAIKSIFP